MWTDLARLWRWLRARRIQTSRRWWVMPLVTLWLICIGYPLVVLAMAPALVLYVFNARQRAGRLMVFMVERVFWWPADKLL